MGIEDSSLPFRMAHNAYVMDLPLQVGEGGGHITRAATGRGAGVAAA